MGRVFLDCVVAPLTRQILGSEDFAENHQKNVFWLLFQYRPKTIKIHIRSAPLRAGGQKHNKTDKPKANRLKTKTIKQTHTNNTKTNRIEK